MAGYRILLLSSCTGQKLHQPPEQLKRIDFENRTHMPGKFREREQELAAFSTLASDIYTGQQHKRLMRGIDALRHSEIYQTELYILSAGYGLIRGDMKILPYDCTFETMKPQEIRNWSSFLGIPEAAQHFFKQKADLVMVMLGEKYLRSLQLNTGFEFQAKTLFFASHEALHLVPENANVHIIPLNNQHASILRCGLVSLKGELVARILRRLARDGTVFWEQLLTFEDILLPPDAQLL